MADQERTRLLETHTRRPPRRPYCKVALAVVLLAALVFIFIRVHIAFVTSATDTFSATSQTAQHIFSHFFQAQLKLSKQLQDGTEGTHILIDFEWNSNAKTITYQETHTSISDSSSHDKMISRFIYANNSAVYGLIYGTDEEWFCRNDTESVEWLTVIKIILQKRAVLFTGRQANDSTCTGSEFYTTEGHIVLCIQGSRLVYIDHGGTRAMVTKWNSRSSDVIKLPQKLEQCNFMDPNIPHLQEGIVSTDDYITKSENTLLKTKRRKHCLFIHGAGERPPTDSYKDMGALPIYWGSFIEHYTPQCLTRRFMWYNSIDRGWDDTKTHEWFCEFAIGNSSRPISNTMLFTHSMGNLVVAAAFHRRICKFDHRTSIWYSIQAPWRGSKVSDELQTLCSKKNFGTKITYIVLRELHYCEPNSNHPSHAYVTMNTSYISPTGVSYNDLIRTAKRHISGAVCGTSAFGMDMSFSMSARLHLVSAYTQLSLPNDGLVAFESCNIKGEFDDRPTSHFYRGRFNHAEGTCRFGERKTFANPRQHPCRWYCK